MSEMDEQERAAYRAFVRENHPDRGGDVEVFVAGLARFRPGAAGTVPGNGGPAEARFDAPVEVVAPLALPVRVAVALLRTARWRRRSRRVQ